MLCTSGFVDYDMFSYNGRYGASMRLYVSGSHSCTDHLKKEGSVKVGEVVVKAGELFD